jgi:hypothetical protein
MTRPTVVSWRRRYVESGIEGLSDLDRLDRPASIDDADVVVATLQKPPESLGVTHWSARLLADQLGISFASAARIWRKLNLQPWRTETFKFSTDPGWTPRCMTRSGCTRRSRGVFEPEK